MSHDVTVLLARPVPLVLAVTLALLVTRRWSDLAAVELVSLVTLCLSLRVVFDVNIFGYYFAPMAAGVILIDAVRCQWREGTLAWLLVLALGFMPFGRGVTATGRPWFSWPAVTLVVGTVAVSGLMVALALARRRWHGYWFALFVVSTVVLLIGPRGHSSYVTTFPLWAWQTIVTVGGLTLVSEPLVTRRRHGRTSNADAVVASPSSPSLR